MKFNILLTTFVAVFMFSSCKNKTNNITPQPTPHPIEVVVNVDSNVVSVNSDTIEISLDKGIVVGEDTVKNVSSLLESLSNN